MRDLAAAGAFAVVAVAVFILTLPFPPGAEGSLSPALYPRMLAAAILLLSLLLAVHAVRAQAAPEQHRGDAPAADAAPVGVPALAAAEVVGLTVLYVAVWTHWRFLLPTVAYVAVVSRLSGKRGWGPALLFGAAVTAVLYLAFGYILRVPLDGI